MRLLLCSLLFVTVGLPACTTAQQPGGGGVVDATAFKALVDQGGVQLIDVRTPAEVARGRIAGSVNIDIAGRDFDARIGDLDKNKPVLVYCAAGGRSATAREVMLAAGFRTVYDLDGGLGAWQAAGLPVEK